MTTNEWREKIPNKLKKKENADIFAFYLNQFQQLKVTFKASIFLLNLILRSLRVVGRRDKRPTSPGPFNIYSLKYLCRLVPEI